MSAADPGTALIRRHLVSLTIERAFRIIPARYADRPLGCVPALNRFGTTDCGYAVLYAGLTVGCAVWEALLRDDYLDARRNTLARGELDARSLVTLATREPVTMVDLRGPRSTKLKIATAVTRDRRHAAGRAFGARIHRDLPEVDGIVFDGRLTGEPVVALFDRALDRMRSLDVIPLATSAGVRDVLTEHDIALASGMTPS